MQDWEERLRKAQHDWMACAATIEQSQQKLRDYVVSLSDDPAITMDELAAATGWSVSYLRALRSRSSVKRRPGGRPSEAARGRGISATQKRKLDSLTKDVHRATAMRASRKQELVTEIRVVTNSPTLKDVAEALGLSHQRVSQLLSE